MRSAALAFSSLLVALACTQQAAAQSDDLATTMTGDWELSTAARNRTCVLNLSKDKSGTGMKLTQQTGCKEALPFMGEVVAWGVRGLDLVRLLDAKGQPVLDLSEVESGILEGQRTGEGVYLLQTLAAAQAAQKSTDQLIGNWTIQRGNNRVICAVTLTNTDAGNESFQLFVRPRCDALVTNFAPVAWKIERGELLFAAANGNVWRFEADDNAQWRRVPDTADPVLLVRN